MSVTIKLRKGLASEWAANNSIVLASGEPGLEIDTGRLKIGNGTTQWGSLQYASIIPSGFIAGSGIDIDLGSNGSTATISISGLINNPANNRILTSRDNTSTGIDAESNLTFNGTSLNVVGNGGVTAEKYTANPTGITNTPVFIGNYDGNPHFQVYTGTTTSSGALGLGIQQSPQSAAFNVFVNNITNYSRTKTSDLVANTGFLDQMVFNTGLADPDLLAGQLQWNSTEGTLDLGLNDNYAMHLGEEMLYRVRNTTGSTLLAGSPVYASGLSPGGNNRIEVNLYAADGTIREIRFMGLITEDLPDGGNNGYATHFGYIRGIDTRGNAATYGTTNKLWSTGEPAWNEGDILYVHPTVSGKLTKIEPKHSISVAIVTNVASNGKLFVRPTSYGHLDDNHDVAVSGATNGQFLQYNSSTDYWVPSSSGNFTTLLVNGTGVSVSGHTHTSSNITDFNSSVSGLLPTIANSGNNRILTSTGSSVGINAESNLTFDGSFLKVVADSSEFGQGNNGYVSISDDYIGGELGIVALIQGVSERCIAYYRNDGSYRYGGDYGYEFLVMSSGGNIGIGTDNPLYKLHVVGSGVVDGQLNIDNLQLDGNTLSSTSGNIIINPSGNGAIQRDAGGNARGQYAVDWQTVRSTGTMVAGGDYSVIGGGRNNTSSGSYSTIGGGIINTASGGSSIVAGGASNTSSGYFTTVGGGYGNTSGSTGSTIGGGRINTSSAYYSTVGGGYSNTSSGSNSTVGGGSSNTSSGHSSVVGGGGNNTSSTYYSTVGGGYSNTSSGSNSTVGGGYRNTSSGHSSVVGGGRYNTSSAYYSTVPGGLRAQTTNYGELSHAAGLFEVPGDAQHTILIARRLTTNATANQALFLNGSSARLIIPAETTWTFSIKLSAYNDTDNQGGWWIIRGGIRRNAANGTALIGSLITESGVESSLSTASASVVADDTNEALEIRVTGVASKNIRWVAVVDISQVSWTIP